MYLPLRGLCLVGGFVRCLLFQLVCHLLQLVLVLSVLDLVEDLRFHAGSFFLLVLLLEKQREKQRVPFQVK